MKTHAELVAIARAHAEAEGRNDLATALATLESDPVYELQRSGERVYASERLLRRMLGPAFDLTEPH